MGSVYLGNTKVGIVQTYTSPDLSLLHIQNKTITPTVTTQTISADTGYDCLGEVTVRAVTSSIDSNITASNVRSGTEILGVLGTLEERKPEQTKTATLSTSGNVLITPSTGYTLSSVVVPQVTSAIDNNITASNIKAGVRILGVEGTYETPSVITTITPSTSLQTVTPSTGYVFSQVTVPAVTSSIDANISGGNIKSGVSILGVTGTYETPAVNVTVNPSKVLQTINPISGQHFNTITVNPVTASIDQNIIASNIKKDINILGVTGTAETLEYKYFDTQLQDYSEIGYNFPTSGYENLAYWAFYSADDTELGVDVDQSIQFIFDFNGAVSNPTLTYDGNGVYTINSNNGVAIKDFQIQYNTPTLRKRVDDGTYTVYNVENPYYGLGKDKQIIVEFAFPNSDSIGYQINHNATHLKVKERMGSNTIRKLPRSYLDYRFNLGRIYSITGYGNYDDSITGMLPPTFSFRIKYIDFVLNDDDFGNDGY